MELRHGTCSHEHGGHQSNDRHQQTIVADGHHLQLVEELATNRLSFC
jgi:hypothetical protein